MRDGNQADKLLEWIDDCNVAPVIPESNISLRSDRTIDFAAIIGIDLSIQTYEDNTSSDHKPLLGVLSG